MLSVRNRRYNLVLAVEWLSGALVSRCGPLIVSEERTLPCSPPDRHAHRKDAVSSHAARGRVCERRGRTSVTFGSAPRGCRGGTTIRPISARRPRTAGRCFGRRGLPPERLRPIAGDRRRQRRSGSGAPALEIRRTRTLLARAARKKRPGSSTPGAYCLFGNQRGASASSGKSICRRPGSRGLVRTAGSERTPSKCAVW